MTVKERILTIRLIEKIVIYSNRAGQMKIKVVDKK